MLLRPFVCAAPLLAASSWVLSPVTSGKGNKGEFNRVYIADSARESLDTMDWMVQIRHSSVSLAYNKPIVLLLLNIITLIA